MSDSSSSTTDYHYYDYNPSKIGPLIIAGLFGVGLFLHLFLTIKYKCFRYWWPFLGGCVFEVAGYLFRELSVHKPLQSDNGQTPYILQTVFIIIAPALLAASLYMTFGRIMLWVGPEHSLISPKWVTKTFVSFDVASFLIQCAGGGILGASKSNTNYKLGKMVLVIGFFIQIASFGTFFMFAIMYKVRARRAGVPRGDWSKLMWGLYMAIIFIFDRSIYRTVEYLDGNGQTGFFLSHEIYFYLLEAVPIVLTVYTMVFYHPSRCGLPNNKNEKAILALEGGNGKHELNSISPLIYQKQMA